MKLIVVLAVTAYFVVQSGGNPTPLRNMEEVEITDRRGKYFRKHQIIYSGNVSSCWFLPVDGNKFNLNLLLDCVGKGVLCDSPKWANCCEAGLTCTKDYPSGYPYYGRASGYSYCR